METFAQRMEDICHELKEVRESLAAIADNPSSKPKDNPPSSESKRQPGSETSRSSPLTPADIEEFDFDSEAHNHNLNRRF